MNPSEPYKNPKLRAHEPNYNKHFRENFQLWTASNPRGRTSNPSEPKFANQNLTTNPPEPSKNLELQTHELDLTQHYFTLRLHFIHI